MADFQDFIKKTAGQIGVLVCYTDTIKNCTRAQGRRTGGVLFVCMERGRVRGLQREKRA